MISFDVEIDVTAEAAIGRRAKTVATVFAPEPDQIPAQPVVCFALPGGAYSRRYFSFDMPDSHGGGGQAGFHVERGWVFVAIDSLGFGESTSPGGHDLTLDNTAAANAHTVAVIGRQLAKGTLNPAVPPLGDFCSIGIGQSMGGCFTVVQQAQHESYDAVGILGFSTGVTAKVADGSLAVRSKRLRSAGPLRFAREELGWRRRRANLDFSAEGSHRQPWCACHGGRRCGRVDTPSIGNRLSRILRSRADPSRADHQRIHPELIISGSIQS